MIVKVVVPDSIYARVYFARGEQGAVGPTGNTGPKGPSGIVNVDSPITNSGTSTAANIGINQALLQIIPAQVTGTAVITTDSRLSDQRVPTDGSVTDTKIVAGGLSPNRITGTAVITTDSRLSDARTPLAHAATHGSAGTDPVTLAQSQVTNLVSDLAAKAPSASPTFTGTITTPVTSGSLLWTNSSGVLGKVGDAPGLGYVPYTGAVSGGIAWQELAKLVKTDSANTFTVGGHIVANSVAGTIPWIIRGAASQSVNLFELQRSDAVTLFRVRQNGQFGTGSQLTGTNAWINNDITGSTVGLIIRGASGQSNDLLAAQNSAGSTLFSIASTGAVFTNSTLFATLQTFIYGAGDYNAALNVQTRGTGNQGIVVRGRASQTANLQEWQDSAGTVLSSVLSGGAMRAPFFQVTSSGLVTITSENSGGSVRIAKQTATGANPGAGYGNIYFRDGTNAGTLKLVVRAGAAGAETTILDNIPT